MSYNPAKNAKESYDLAIAKCREKLESFPMVEIGDCRLYQGDCLEIMPYLPKFDAVVTDPPYGIDRANGFGSGGFGKNGAKRKCVKKHSGNWDKERVSDVVINIILDLSDNAIIWGAQFYANYLPVNGKWLLWDKLQTMPSFGDGEIAWTNLNGTALKKISLSINGVIAKGETGKHPTQKPLELMKWCIGHLPDTSQTILDPFMGSGTTGVACVKLGRKFTGIELDPRYFDIACKRIEEAYKQPDLFIEQPKETLTQADIFEGVK